MSDLLELRIYCSGCNAVYNTERPKDELNKITHCGNCAEKLTREWIPKEASENAS